ncbi:claspin [Drosophila suzukii]|uniref:Claspin n=1 Tax=Drosophila suzukii TaxID=28584 RepID=A0AB39YXG8_DROSZ
MEKVDKKAARREAKERRRKFLEEEQWEKLDAGLAAHDCCGDVFRNFDGHTHEAWLLQCPKGTDPRQLDGKRLKLPGKKRLGNLRVRAVGYSTPHSETVGYVSSKGKYAIRNLPLAGYVVVSKRPKAQQPVAGEEEQEFPTIPPPPKILVRNRHPLFGSDYQHRIELPEEISKSLRQADKKNLKTKAKLYRTANYYKIRSKLLATTQTLEQKEQLVRQSVLTGLKPQFMESITLTNHSDEEAEEAAPVKKIKKKKNNGSVEENGYELVKIKEEDSSPSKKQKKRKSNGKISVNGEENILDDVENREEEVIASKKQKRKSNGQMLVNGATNNLDEVVVIDDKPASVKKRKKARDNEVVVIDDDDVEVKKEQDVEVKKEETAEAPPRKRKKQKTVE